MKTLIVLLFFGLSFYPLFGQVDGKRHHVSINGTPNGFFLISPKTHSTYLGLALLPELEYSYDMNETARFYVSALWTGINQLTATEPVNTNNEPAQRVEIHRASQSNAAISVGFNFNISSDDNKNTMTFPIVNSFSAGVGYGNFSTGLTNDAEQAIFQEGFILVVGFKIKGISFNFGNSKRRNE